MHEQQRRKSANAANAKASKGSSKSVFAAEGVSSGFLPGNLKWVSDVVFPIAFAVFAFYILVGKNADYLYATQERSIFIFDGSFLDMMLQQPGGLLMWLGCFFTQFFHSPWVGSLLLILIWMGIYFLTVGTFRMGGAFKCLALLIPAAMLCSVVGIGYWIYYVKSPGYCFSGSLGMLFMMAALFAYSRMSNKWLRMGWMAVWTAAGYVAFGWYALLGALCMALAEWMFSRNRNEGGAGVPWLTYVLGALLMLIIAVPVVCYQFYTKLNLTQAWFAALPLFQVDTLTSLVPDIPYIFAAVVAAVLCFIPLKTEWDELHKASMRTASVVVLNIAALAFVAFGVIYWNFDDERFHTELRVYRAIDESRWNDALEEVGNMETSPTREIIILRNIALMNVGKLGTSMFKYDNKSVPPANFDSLQIRMAQTNGPITYLNYGRTNFATRWCIENAVERGFSIDSYKILLRCALVSGEYDLAQKYIDILKKTLYYKDWAERYEAVNGDSVKISRLQGMESISELHNHFSSILDGDEGLIEMYLLGYFSHTRNKDSQLVTDVTLTYSLISKDIQLFWPQFFLYATLHPKELMPIHYQEAAFLYGNLEHQVDISSMPFDQELVVNRYNSFQQISQSYLQQGMDTEQVGEAMRPMFGDTFWWFYFFARNIQSY